MYLASHSSIMGILDIVYYTLFGVWKCVIWFNNYSFSSTPFSFSLCWIAIWSSSFYKLQVTI
jgi:hypothetical protein